MPRFIIGAAFAIIALAGPAAAQDATKAYDVVIANGRVMDPETGAGQAPKSWFARLPGEGTDPIAGFVGLYLPS